MIEKLRRKFLLVAMLSFTLVVVVILGVTNGVHLYTLYHENAEKLDLLESNQGLLPEHPYSTAGWKHNDKLYWQNHEDDETLYELRYFTVYLDTAGQVQGMNIQRTATVKQSDAKAFALQAWQSGQGQGFIDCYLYRIAEAGNDRQMCIFVNCHHMLADVQQFLLLSIIVSVTGLLLVFGVCLLLSGKAIQPFIDNYSRQKRFITDASHELKTPLAIISANTEVIEMIDGESDWTQSTRKQIDRMNTLVENLVFLSRMDEEQYVMEKADFNLSDVVIDTAAAFHSLAEQHQKHIELDAEPNIVYHGNEAMIRQTLNVLLENAVKYADDNTIIRCSLACREKPVLTIENQAQGLTPGNQEQLFRRFYRSDASRTRKDGKGGYGIGLSVAEAIVTAHGGHISAESPDGQLIRFTIQL